MNRGGQWTNDGIGGGTWRRLVARWTVRVGVVGWVGLVLVGGRMTSAAEVAGGAGGAPGGAAAVGVDWVGRWLGAQTNLQTWRASVRQVREFKALAQPVEERGRVSFSAPDRFRWEMGEPARTIAVRVPGEMLVIYPRLQRAERCPLDGAAGAGPWKETLALLEAGFPRSRAELEGRFRVMSQTMTNGVCVVRMQPRAASARRMMPELAVSFGADDLMLRGTELHFADGSVMRNEFSAGELNPVLDPKLFAVEVGPGVEVVEPLRAKGR